MKTLFTPIIFFFSLMHYSIAQKAEIILQTNHITSIISVSASYDGTYTATLADQGQIKIWDNKTGLQVGKIYEELDYYADKILFHPTKNELFIDQKTSVVRLDLTTKKILKEHHVRGNVFDFTVSNDGKGLAIGSDSSLVYFDLEKEYIFQVFQKEIGVYEGTHSVELLDNCNTLISGDSDGFLRKWHVESGKLQKEVNASPLDRVHEIAFNQKTEWLISSDNTDTLKVWDKNLNLKKHIVLNREFPNFLIPSPVKNELLVGYVEGFESSRGMDFDEKEITKGYLEMWDLKTNHNTWNYEQEGGFKDAVFQKNGKTIIAVDRNQQVQMFDEKNGNVLRTFGVKGSLVNDFLMDKKNKRLFVAGDDSFVKVWDFTAAKIKQVIGDGKDGRITALGYDEEKGWLAVAHDHLIKIYNYSAKQETFSLLKKIKIIERGTIRKVFFLSDEEILISYNRRTEAMIATAKFFSQYDVRSATEEQDKMSIKYSNYITKVLNDNIGFGKEFPVFSFLEIWNWKDSTGIQIPDYSGEATEVAVSPDRKNILYNSSEGTLHHLDWEKKDYKGTMSLHSKTVTACRYSPNGVFAASGGAESEVSLLEFRDGKVNVHKFGEFQEIINDFAFSGNSQFLAIAAGLKLEIWDLEKMERIFWRINTEVIENVSFSPDHYSIVIAGKEDAIKIWDLTDANKSMRWIGVGRSAYIAMDENNYYQSSKDALSGVAFTSNNNPYTFEQFDLYYNRPDFILERMKDAPKGLAKQYHQAYLRRIDKLKITPDNTFNVPFLQIKNAPTLPTITEQEQINLAIEASDELFNLDRILVSVNGVIVNGYIKGIGLGKGKKVNQDIPVQLSEGLNQIQVSVVNEKGVESLKENMVVSKKGHTTLPKLYLVCIGTSKYQDANHDITFPAKDAKDLAAAFSKYSKYEVRKLVLTDGDFSKGKMDEVKNHLLQSTENDIVIFFISGHGVRDEQGINYYYATQETDFSKPEDRGIAYDYFEDLMSEVKSRNKILCLNTCHSGEIDRPEVYEEYQAYQLMRSVFVDLRRGSGTQVLSASEGSKTAKEIVGSRKIKNGLLVQAIIKALQDQQSITVSELFTYIQQDTKRYEMFLKNNLPVIRFENTGNDFKVW